MGPHIRIEIRADERAGKRKQGQRLTAAQLRIDRTRTGAGNGPAHPKDQAAQNHTLLKRLFFDFDGLALQRFELEAL